jgi:hypothetical protein
MTVRREQSEIFHASTEKIVEAVRSVLANGQPSYKYHRAVESDDHLIFNTVVRPSWWPLLAATKMRIRLIPNDSQTKVVVDTQSQLFILGDVFNIYNGYIRDVLGAIRSRVETHA